LPLVSLLGILWLWHDTGDTERIASHAESTFWYILPSLPMFLVFPAMLRAGVGFGHELRSDPYPLFHNSLVARKVRDQSVSAIPPANDVLPQASRCGISHQFLRRLGVAK
jgi:hypothetical protein